MNNHPFVINFSVYNQFDQSIFTGFLYRVSIVFLTITFLIKKQWLLGAFLYLFACGLSVISESEFRGQPFILFAVLCMGMTSTLDWWSSEIKKYLKSGLLFISLIISILTLWLCIQTGNYLVKNRPQWSYETQFSSFESSKEIFTRQFACDTPDVKIIDYPGGIYTYWFTDLKPVSKFIYMWPWVAEIGLSDVIHNLDQKNIFAVVRIQDTVVWNLYATKVYLEPFYQYLSAHYQMIEKGIYISPALFNKCAFVK
jgi:hypothetical protein